MTCRLVEHLATPNQGSVILLLVSQRTQRISSLQPDGSIFVQKLPTVLRPLVPPGTGGDWPCVGVKQVGSVIG